MPKRLIRGMTKGASYLGASLKKNAGQVKETVGRKASKAGQALKQGGAQIVTDLKKTGSDFAIGSRMAKRKVEQGATSTKRAISEGVKEGRAAATPQETAGQINAKKKQRLAEKMADGRIEARKQRIASQKQQQLSSYRETQQAEMSVFAEQNPELVGGNPSSTTTYSTDNISRSQQSYVSNVLNQTAGSGKSMKSGPIISLDNNSALDKSLTDRGFGDLNLGDIQNSNPSQTTPGPIISLDNISVLDKSLTDRGFGDLNLGDIQNSNPSQNKGFFGGLGSFYGSSFDAARGAIGNQSEMTFSDAGSQIADSFGDLNLGQQAAVGYSALSAANVGRRLVNNQDGLIRDSSGRVNNAFTPLNPLF